MLYRPFCFCQLPQSSRLATFSGLSHQKQVCKWGSFFRSFLLKTFAWILPHMPGIARQMWESANCTSCLPLSTASRDASALLRCHQYIFIKKFRVTDLRCGVHWRFLIWQNFSTTPLFRNHSASLGNENCCICLCSMLPQGPAWLQGICSLSPFLPYHLLWVLQLVNGCTLEWCQWDIDEPRSEVGWNGNDETMCHVLEHPRIRMR